MPDSGAVYQPTTVGYTYDTGGNGPAGSGGFRQSLWRIMSRHKIISRKSTEWIFAAIAMCFFIAGLTTMIVSLVSSDNATQKDSTQDENNLNATTMKTEVEDHVDDTADKITLGAGLMLVGLLWGFAWACLRFFLRSKSPRNGMTGSSGQMLGGLNPSTDLLVGSTSQYGPVLTELPSQMKLKQAGSHDAPVVPLSDQEEETHTLMQESTMPLTVSSDPNASANQIPG